MGISLKVAIPVMLHSEPTSQSERKTFWTFASLSMVIKICECDRKSEELLLLGSIKSSRTAKLSPDLKGKL